jgi:hypothetical protein
MTTRSWTNSGTSSPSVGPIKPRRYVSTDGPFGWTTRTCRPGRSNVEHRQVRPAEHLRSLGGGDVQPLQHGRSEGDRARSGEGHLGDRGRPASPGRQHSAAPEYRTKPCPRHQSAPASWDGGSPADQAVDGVVGAAQPGGATAGVSPTGLPRSPAAAMALGAAEGLSLAIAVDTARISGAAQAAG